MLKRITDRLFEYPGLSLMARQVAPVAAAQLPPRRRLPLVAAVWVTLVKLSRKMQSNKNLGQNSSTYQLRR